jgi:hypothetical protein
MNSCNLKKPYGMVYEKGEYLIRKWQNDEINGVLWKVKQIVQHVLKVQWLPNYIKVISMGLSLFKSS